MIVFLSFLLAWLCGYFIILATSFALYEQFSIIDITSFAVFSLAGSLVVVLLFYRLVIKFLLKIYPWKNQYVFFPLALILAGNLPVYFFAWLKYPELYGRSEALLFTLFFITAAFVSGLCEAWKNNVLKKG
jgi:hypothetical protein